MRRYRARTLVKIGWRRFTSADGNFGDEGVANAFNCYGDPAMETLLEKTIGLVSEVTSLNLYATNTYWRLYERGDELQRHKDRPSCEVAATLCLGYEMNSSDLEESWGIWMDPTGGQGNAGEEVKLKPGEMVIYKGCEIEHWRRPFMGKEHAQVFLFYNDRNGPFGEACIHDGRPCLGLPAETRMKSKVKKIDVITKRLMDRDPSARYDY